MLANAKVLSHRASNTDLHKIHPTAHDELSKESFSFVCKNHSKKPIVFVCTSKNCEANLLCAECVIESPSLLIKYKDSVYTIQDYIESSKVSLLQVRIEKEFQTLKKKLDDSLEAIKEDLKNSFLASVGSHNRDDTTHRGIEKKLVDASVSVRASRENDDIFNKENLQKFIKESNKYDDMQKKYYETAFSGSSDSNADVKYFEFLANVRLQVDSLCRNVQKQASTFMEKIKESNDFKNRNSQDIRRPQEETHLYSNEPSSQKIADTSPVNFVPHPNMFNMSLGEDEEVFNFDQEAHENYESHKQQQLKGLIASFPKDPVDDSNTAPYLVAANKVSKNMPKDTFKALSEFPSTYNSIVAEAIVKYGPLRFDMHDANNYNIDTMGQEKVSRTKRMKYGPILLENGDVYEGEWSEDKRDGYGKLLSATGFLYEGFWKDNLAHGKGRLINVNGDMYEGDWAVGKYHGRGTFIGTNGYQYIGDWSQDMQHGYGSEYWPDGSSYEGEYKWSKKHGQGVFKWANGEKYMGEFCLNNMHGNGIYEWPNGQRYYGCWSENKISGEGRLEKPKNSTKMEEWEKKVLLSPECGLFKRDSEAGENLRVDPRVQYS